MTAAEIVRVLGRGNPPASLERLEQAETQLGFKLPDPIREILLLSDGVEGFLEPQSAYLAFYPIEEVLKVNKAHQEFKPRRELIAFGGDGGGGGYFCDYSKPGPQYYLIDWISDWQEDAVPCGGGFDEFIETIRTDRIFG